MLREDANGDDVVTAGVSFGSVNLTDADAGLQNAQSSFPPVSVDLHEASPGGQTSGSSKDVLPSKVASGTPAPNAAALSMPASLTDANSVATSVGSSAAPVAPIVPQANSILCCGT